MDDARRNKVIEALRQLILERRPNSPYITARVIYDTYIAPLERKTEDASSAAERLCEIYFNIAAAAVGEDIVRRQRDAALAAPDVAPVTGNEVA